MIHKMCRFYRKKCPVYRAKENVNFKGKKCEKVKCLCGPNKSLLNITSPCLRVYFCGSYNKNNWKCYMFNHIEIYSQECMWYRLNNRISNPLEL